MTASEAFWSSWFTYTLIGLGGLLIVVVVTTVVLMVNAKKNDR